MVATTRLGQVQTVRLPGTDLVVRLLEPQQLVSDGSIAAAATPKVEGLVVLCHGFGAPGTDLVGLAHEICEQRPGLVGRVAFAFPEAPLEPPELAMFGGRAWWNLDLQRIEAMMRAGQVRDLAGEVPDGMGSARRKLRATLDALTGRYDLATGRVVLGGFSQGAMLTTETALKLEEAPAGLVVLSGTLVNLDGWLAAAPKRSGLPVLQSHGRRDPVLPFAGAEALKDMLSAAGLAVDFRAFPGEHTIPWEIITAVSAFVDDCLFGASASL